MDGVNAYISEARARPEPDAGRVRRDEPAERPRRLEGTDIIATAGLVGGIFGKGGGSEMQSAVVLALAQKRYGRNAGKRVWGDFRSAEDPEAPITVHKKHFRYMATPRHVAKGSRALPDAGSLKPVPIRQGSAPAPGGGGQTCLPGGLVCLPKANSNALVVGASCRSRAARSPSSGRRPATSRRRS